MYNKNNSRKSLENKIKILQDLRIYMYSRHRKKIIENKIRELKKELNYLYR